MMLFLDLDGVLADFDAHHEAVVGYRPDKLKDNADWASVTQCPMFYATMPLMPDAMQLWEFCASHSPTILTGLPRMVGCGKQKEAWVATWLGENVPVITCKSREKAYFCSPGDILVDDWDKYRNLWIVKGGIWVTHTDASSTIIKLRALGL